MSSKTCLLKKLGNTYRDLELVGIRRGVFLKCMRFFNVSFCLEYTIIFLLSGTLGDGIVAVPISLAMHSYGDGEHPSFLPNFVVYVILSTIAAAVIWCKVRGKVSRIIIIIL